MDLCINVILLICIFFQSNNVHDYKCVLILNSFEDFNGKVDNTSLFDDDKTSDFGRFGNNSNNVLSFRNRLLSSNQNKINSVLPSLYHLI